MIAYDREPDEYRHSRLLDHGRGDWAMTIARRYLYETSDAVRLDALIDGTWAPLADLCGKLVREERYHQMHVNAWFSAAGAWARRAARAVAGGARDPRARMPVRSSRHSPVNRHWSRPGILAAPMTELEARWRATIAPTFAALDLPMPPPTARPTMGRQDHGADFAWLWGEFTQRPSERPGGGLVSEAGTQVGIARARAGIDRGDRRVVRLGSTKQPSGSRWPR